MTLICRRTTFIPGFCVSSLHHNGSGVSPSQTRPLHRGSPPAPVRTSLTYASRVRRLDLLWWILFGTGAAAWTAVLIGVYAGWNPPPLFLAGLTIYGLVLALTYHGFRIRRFWGQHTP